MAHQGEQFLDYVLLTMPGKVSALFPLIDLTPWNLNKNQGRIGLLKNEILFSKSLTIHNHPIFISDFTWFLISCSITSSKF